jgi:hypothetical protein
MDQHGGMGTRFVASIEDVCFHPPSRAYLPGVHPALAMSVRNACLYWVQAGSQAYECIQKYRHAQNLQAINTPPDDTNSHYFTGHTDRITHLTVIMFLFLVTLTIGCTYRNQVCLFQYHTFAPPVI